jgi:hypothetical protein
MGGFFFAGVFVLITVAMVACSQQSVVIQKILPQQATLETADQTNNPQPSSSLNPIYSLIVRNRTPMVNPGQTVQVEVFLSGYGIPAYNKLNIDWSSPYVINNADPGTLTVSIAAQTNASDQLQLLAGNKYLMVENLSTAGEVAFLDPGFFMPLANENSGLPYEITPTAAENEWDNNPPILLKLNTSKQAEAGDYNISFIFTYDNGQNIVQNQAIASFHVTNWWERNEAWVTIVGVVFAVLSLLTSSIFSIWQFSRRH